MSHLLLRRELEKKTAETASGSGSGGTRRYKKIRPRPDFGRKVRSGAN